MVRWIFFSLLSAHSDIDRLRAWECVYNCAFVDRTAWSGLAESLTNRLPFCSRLEGGFGERGDSPEFLGGGAEPGY